MRRPWKGHDGERNGFAMEHTFKCLTILLLLRLTTSSIAAEIEPTWESMNELHFLSLRTSLPRLPYHRSTKRRAGCNIFLVGQRHFT